ncbi:MAG: methyltransferase domain-containing protein [Acidimicrobiales bacterium]
MTPSLVDALSEVANGDRRAATTTVERCVAAHPSDLLAASMLDALRSTSGDVYATPDGFRAFIDNASNVTLYDATIGHLRRRHDELRPASVVDIGCGDGRVTHACLAPNVSAVHLVEPSESLLGDALARTDWAVTPTPHCADLSQFVATLDAADHFALVQSTFALHTIAPAERSRALASLRARTDRLIVVDFDVPAFADRSREHAEYAIERYRIGVGEYAEIPEAISGFLMPVLLGQFDPGATRHTFEQPVARWIDEVAAAGFDPTVEIIDDYWWGPAFCLEAS